MSTDPPARRGEGRARLEREAAKLIGDEDASVAEVHVAMILSARRAS